MAVLSVYPFSPVLQLPSASCTDLLCHFPARSLFHLSKTREKGDRRKAGSRRFVALSTHSNPRILKPNRKSRYGQTLSPYDSDDEESFDFDEGEDDDEDWFDDVSSPCHLAFSAFYFDEFAEVADYGTKRKRDKPNIHNDRIIEKESQSEKRWGLSSSSSGRDFYHESDYSNVRNVKKNLSRNVGGITSTSNYKRELGSHDINGRSKMGIKDGRSRYPRLSEEIDLDRRWIPLLDYLSTFGLKESHFLQMYERHMLSLQINVCSARERLDYLMSIGVKQSDVKRILLRQPQILEYTVENNLKSHVAFLMGLGIPNSRIGQIIAAAPSLFSYSVEKSLKPTVRYLVEEVGIKEKELGKVVQLSPQILVQRIDISWNTRYIFLSEELGAPRDSIVKMVTKHPQLLHYSIDDGLLPRINFLRSIGMCNSDILKILTSLTQVLSLSLEDNLKPKYLYLINELRNEKSLLFTCPSLDLLMVRAEEIFRTKTLIGGNFVINFVKNGRNIYDGMDLTPNY
ncbi:hypothetical protein CDL15_Pgr007387 [Punica granatum]|uniref:Transcription termination factor MTERF9, chloroplastic n=1 Tax=Punica granatum TaxID=22663 RepID=A0A218X9H1_PUNGR|nr:hypothetical protein CDL15_Pgr007387 [Punica granatum]